MLPYAFLQKAKEGWTLKPYMQAYEKFLRQTLEAPDCDYAAMRKEILVQIGFMQHERLIHFLVTMLFSLLFIIAFCLFLFQPSVGTMLLAALLLALLIPYIGHYYFLENTVQKMYILYNQCAAKADGIMYPNTDVRK